MKAINLKIDRTAQNKAEQFIDNIFEDFKISDSLYGSVLMPVIELIYLVSDVKLNGIAEIEKIQLQAYVEPGKLFIEISNQKRIDFRKAFAQIKTPGADNNQLFIINALTDDIRYSEDGDLISMEFNMDVDKQLKFSDRGNLLKDYLRTSNKNIRV